MFASLVATRVVSLANRKQNQPPKALRMMYSTYILNKSEGRMHTCRTLFWNLNLLERLS